MGQRNPTHPLADNDAKSESLMIVFGTVASTSWRMFVPVLGLTLVGYVLDKALSTLPILVFVGLGLGIVIATLLVVLQYKDAVKEGGKR